MDGTTRAKKLQVTLSSYFLTGPKRPRRIRVDCMHATRDAARKRRGKDWGLTHDRLRVPPPNVCRWCEGVGTVALDVHIVGGSVCLRFSCRACAQRWAAAPARKSCCSTAGSVQSIVGAGHGWIGEEVPAAEVHNDWPRQPAWRSQRPPRTDVADEAGPELDETKQSERAVAARCRADRRERSRPGVRMRPERQDCRCERRRVSTPGPAP